jgi:tetratricopeptide (TPR) repeat protein
MWQFLISITEAGASPESLIYALVVLNAAFLLLASVGALLLKASFTRRQRTRFPILRKLDGKKLVLTLACVVFLLLGYASYAVKEIVVRRSSFRVTPGPGVSQAVIATPTGLDVELNAAAAQRANAARALFSKAETHFMLGQYREAADYYRKSAEAMPTLAAALNHGLALRYIPDYPRAETTLRAGLRDASQKRRGLYVAHFSLYLSSVLISLGSLEEADRLVRQAYATYESIDDSFGQASAHLNTGNIFAAQGSSSQAIGEWRRALNDYQIARSFLGEANARNNIGTMYLSGLKLSDAAAEFEAALALYSAVANKTGAARASTNLALIYALQGRLTEALALSLDALDLSKRQGDLEQRAAALLAIGMIYEEKGEFADAVTVELEALEFAREAGTVYYVALAHYYLASSYRLLNKPAESRDHALKVIALQEKGVIPIVVGGAWVELGLGYLSQGRLEESADALGKALAVRGSPELQANIWVAFAKLDVARKRHDSALVFLDQANRVYTGAGMNTVVSREAKQMLWRHRQTR